MNAFCGIVHLDGKPISRDLFARCEFESPHWKPDRKEILFTEKAAFASTQRFITPESHNEQIPLRHADSGILIVSDSYLTHKDELRSLLSVDEATPDVEVILNAYLKWGEDSPKYLSGDFSLAIWDPRNQKVFLATDRGAFRPCFYSYVKDQYLIFANTVAPFRVLCPKLTINQAVFSHYTIDLFADASTCYHEVKGLPPAHKRVFHKAKSTETQYWSLREQRRRLPYKKREDFYEAFRELFVNSLRAYSRTSFPLMAHISGGLDSSAVATATAKLLAEKQKTLYGFTAIPKDLEGPSYRPGWLYHELPLIQKALQKISNVEHFVFRTDIHADPFEELKPLYPLIDRPFRNIANSHWFLGALKQAQVLQSRSILNGQAGNSTISWTGASWKQRLREHLQAVRLWRSPHRAFDSYFSSLNPEFVSKRSTSRALRRRVVIFDPHYYMLSRNRGFALSWGMRAASLWFGVEVLDPTSDVRLKEYCYNAPQWIYYRGKSTLEKRLLVREALFDLVPEEIRWNPNRGEQAADWYQQYNAHNDRWRKEFDRVASEGSPLWSWYDKIAVDQIFKRYSKIEVGNRITTQQVNGVLMRCLSLGFFINYLNQNTPLSSNGDLNV